MVSMQALSSIFALFMRMTKINVAVVCSNKLAILNHMHKDSTNSCKISHVGTASPI